MRLINATKLIQEVMEAYSNPLKNELIDLIEGQVTVYPWHYPSKGDYPTERDWYLGIFEEADTGFELVPVVCDYVGYKTKATTEEGWIINHCTDVDNPLDYYKKLKCVAWQEIIPPKEEA